MVRPMMPLGCSLLSSFRGGVLDVELVPSFSTAAGADWLFALSPAASARMSAVVTSYEGKAGSSSVPAFVGVFAVAVTLAGVGFFKDAGGGPVGPPGARAVFFRGVLLWLRFDLLSGTEFEEAVFDSPLEGSLGLEGAASFDTVHVALFSSSC